MKKTSHVSPLYTEAVLYMLTLCVVLLLIGHPEMREDFYRIFFQNDGFFYIFLGLAFMVGMPLSLGVVFTKGEKSSTVRVFLSAYLFSLTVFTSLAGLKELALSLKEYGFGLYGVAILICINLIFIMSTFAWRWVNGKTQTPRFSQRDASIPELVANTLVCCSLILLLDILLKLPWIATFEIVMSYGLFFAPLVRRRVAKRVSSI